MTLKADQDLSQEMWQVQNGQRAPTLMTVDELDRAFKNDEVNGRTLVRRAGSLRWRTLSEIAGLSSDDLESESLMPVTLPVGTGESSRPFQVAAPIDMVNPVIPRPPRLPRRASDVIPTEKVAVPVIPPRKAAPMTDVMGDEPIFRLSHRSIVDTEPDVEDADVLPTTDLHAPRGRGVMHLVGLAALALVSGGLIAGGSVWLSGRWPGATDTIVTTATAKEAAATPASLAPSTPVDAPAKALETITVEGSMLVLKNAPASEAVEPADVAVAVKPVAVKPVVVKPVAKPVAPQLKVAPKAGASSRPSFFNARTSGPHFKVKAKAKTR